MAVGITGLIKDQIAGIINRQARNAFEFDDLLTLNLARFLFEGQDITDTVVECFFLLLKRFNFAVQCLFLLVKAAALTLEFAFFSRTSFSISRRALWISSFA
jgi:hypothetical protein